MLTLQHGPDIRPVVARPLSGERGRSSWSRPDKNSLHPRPSCYSLDCRPARDSLPEVQTFNPLRPPGPEFALETFIPAAIDHQNDWVLVEHALNARLYFEPPH